MRILLLTFLSFVGLSLLGGFVHDGFKYFLRFSGSANFFQRMAFAAILRLVPENERMRFVNEILDEFGALDITGVDSAIVLRSAVKIRGLFLPQQISSVIDLVVDPPVEASYLVRREIPLYRGKYHWMAVTEVFYGAVLSSILVVALPSGQSKLLVEDFSGGFNSAVAPYGIQPKVEMYLNGLLGDLSQLKSLNEISETYYTLGVVAVLVYGTKVSFGLLSRLYRRFPITASPSTISHYLLTGLLTAAVWRNILASEIAIYALIIYWVGFFVLFLTLIKRQRIVVSAQRMIRVRSTAGTTIESVAIEVITGLTVKQSFFGVLLGYGSLKVFLGNSINPAYYREFKYLRRVNEVQQLLSEIMFTEDEGGSGESTVSGDPVVEEVESVLLESRLSDP